MARMGGREKACQIYPDGLCRAMLRRIKSELVHSGMLNGEDSDMRMVGGEDVDCAEKL